MVCGMYAWFCCSLKGPEQRKHRNHEKRVAFVASFFSCGPFLLASALSSYILLLLENNAGQCLQLVLLVFRGLPIGRA